MISVVIPRNGGTARPTTHTIVHMTIKCTINFKTFDICNAPHFFYSVGSFLYYLLWFTALSLYPVFFLWSTYKKHLKSGLPFQMLFVFMTDPMITDY